MTPPPSDSEPSSVSIAGLDVLEPIGHGGFSVVFRARQHSLGREVAVKVINTGFTSDVERRRFERECHVLGRLSRHPNIVTVFADAMTTDGRPAIVMELYESTLRDRLSEQGPLPVADVLSMGVAVCGALAEAHAAGVLHRDLKPHNIFVSAYGEPALGDFGISTIDSEKSQSGFGALSIAYAAPETIDDGTVDARSDIYSLGATLYQLVSGEAPFASAEIGQAIRRILNDPPPQITRDGVPRELNDLVLRALAKQPGDRPPTALAFAEELRGLQTRLGHQPTPIPRTTQSSTASPPAAPAALAEQPSGAGSRAPSPLAPPVPTDRTVAREGPLQRDESPPTAPPAPTRRSRLVAIVAAVVLLAFGAAAIIIMTRGDNDGGGSGGDTRPPTSTPSTTTAPPPTPEPAVPITIGAIADPEPFHTPIDKTPAAYIDDFGIDGIIYPDDKDAVFSSIWIGTEVVEPAGTRTAWMDFEVASKRTGPELVTEFENAIQHADEYTISRKTERDKTLGPTYSLIARASKTDEHVVEINASTTYDDADGFERYTVRVERTWPSGDESLPSPITKLMDTELDVIAAAQLTVRDWSLFVTDSFDERRPIERDTMIYFNSPDDVDRSTIVDGLEGELGSIQNRRRRHYESVGDSIEFTSPCCDEHDGTLSWSVSDGYGSVTLKDGL